MKKEIIRNVLYWRWEKNLPKNLCEMFLSEINHSKFIHGQIKDPKNPINKEVRNSKIQFLEVNHWLEGILFNHSQYANSEAGWNYALSGIEPVQISKYNLGEQYDWHQDSALPSIPKVPTRKLSVVTLLSDPSTFEGGGLIIEGCDENLLKNQGDIVVFPSYLNHKALPVESGTRITAAMWISGPPFI